MLCGELQAIFQLAVGLNMGMYALKDISFGNALRSNTDLDNLRLSMATREASLRKIRNSAERDTYLRYLNEAIINSVDRWKKSNKLRIYWVVFVVSSIYGTGLMAFMSLIGLFHVSHFYTYKAHWITILSAYIIYLPGILTIIFHIVIRLLNRPFDEAQKILDDEISKIDFYIASNSV